MICREEGGIVQVASAAVQLGVQLGAYLEQLLLVGVAGEQAVHSDVLQAGGWG